MNVQILNLYSFPSVSSGFLSQDQIGRLNVSLDLGEIELKDGKNRGCIKQLRSDLPILVIGMSDSSHRGFCQFTELAKDFKIDLWTEGSEVCGPEEAILLPAGTLYFHHGNEAGDAGNLVNYFDEFHHGDETFESHYAVSFQREGDLPAITYREKCVDILLEMGKNWMPSSEKSRQVQIKKLYPNVYLEFISGARYLWCMDYMHRGERLQEVVRIVNDMGDFWYRPEFPEVRVALNLGWFIDEGYVKNTLHQIDCFN